MHLPPSSDPKGQLSRSIGLFTAITLVVGSMIGSGVFKKVAPMSAELGSPWMVLLCWFIAGIITLMGALTNAEVAGLIAEPGGQYAYFRRMYGKFFAYLYGWSSFSVIQSATAASVAYIFAESLNSIVPLGRLPADWEAIGFPGYFAPFANAGVKVATIGLLTLLTTINYFGVKYGGRLTTVLASTIVVCIFSIILLCLSASGGTVQNLEHAVATEGMGQGTLGLFGAMFTAMIAAFWAYEGWNTIGFLGGEIKNPLKNVPMSLFYGVGFVILVYLAINFSYHFVLPVENLIAIDTAENQIAAVEVIRSFLGNGGALMISILILMSTFNSTNTTIMGAPRIYFAMAADKVFPKAIAKVHPKYKTPSNSLILQCVWASVLVMSGSFDQLTEMLIFAAFIYYGAGAFGVFVLRRKMKEVPRAYKVWGYPVVPALFVLFSTTLVIVSIITQPVLSAVGLGLIALGIPFYFIRRP